MVSQTQPLPSESLLSTGDRETKASLLSRGDYDNDHQQRIGRTVCVRLRGRPEHETGNKQRRWRLEGKDGQSPRGTDGEVWSNKHEQSLRGEVRGGRLRNGSTPTGLSRHCLSRKT